MANWRSTQTDIRPDGAWNVHRDVERYGTSWMRDLMLAAVRSSAFNSLNVNVFKFTGATDANHAITPRAHSTHDLGMGFDLGVSHMIDSGQTLTAFEQLVDFTQAPASEWQLGTTWRDRALALANLLQRSITGHANLLGTLLGINARNE